MPNWVDTKWNVKLPTKNVKKFLNYFIGSDPEVHKLKGQYFYRTFIEEATLDETECGDDTILTFYSNSAWSLEDLLSGTEEDGVLRCPDLYTVCTNLDVEYALVVGDEPGECFRQRISYFKGQELETSVEDLTLWYCDSCNQMGYWEDEDPQITDRTRCPACGAILEEDSEEE